MLETGLKGTRAMVVTEAESAKHIGSGTVLVLSTPMMIALIEHTFQSFWGSGFLSASFEYTSKRKYFFLMSHSYTSQATK